MRKALQNGVLIAASILVFVLAVEIALRLVDGVPLLVFRNFVALRMAKVTQLTANRTDRLLGWVPMDYYKYPGSAAPSFGKYGIFLKPNEPLDPPQDGILAVGDSFTAGSDVAADQSWPADLQSALHAPVINAAGGGYGVDQLVLRMESLLDPLRPRIAVLSIVTDDIPRNAYQTYGGANKPYFLVRDGGLVPRNDPVPEFVHANDLGPVLHIAGYFYATDRYLRWAGYSALETSLKFRLAPEPVDVGEVSCLLLRRLKDAAEKRRAKLLVSIGYSGATVVVLQSRAEVEGDYIRRTLDCLAKDGIAFVDLWDDYKAILATGMDDYKKLWLIGPGPSGPMPNFQHPSPAGQEFTAQHVAASLIRRGWIEPQPGVTAPR